MKKSFQKLIIFALILGLVCGPVSCGALPKKGAKASSGSSSSVQASESTVVAVPYSGGSNSGNSGNSGSGRNSTPRKITVCIDPGHYHGANHLTGENLYDYEEADANLKIGQELSRILKEEYGIE